ncbi:MAG: histidine phosphatase family protein [Erysipelotrichaceae bacterium]|nr:histidine phosphatase family protein [Erysipelotrichaceae bacterium]
MLFVARHGQTIWNKENKVCGITDVELTEFGKLFQRGKLHGFRETVL